jgi:hypothetical protein
MIHRTNALYEFNKKLCGIFFGRVLESVDYISRNLVKNIVAFRPVIALLGGLFHRDMTRDAILGHVLGQVRRCFHRKGH